LARKKSRFESVVPQKKSSNACLESSVPAEKAPPDIRLLHIKDVQCPTLPLKLLRFLSAFIAVRANCESGADNVFPTALDSIKRAMGSVFN
jgi:hypothetical protein